MAEDKFCALILRSVSISDNANLLTVLCGRRGKKLIVCHGAKKLNGRTMPSVQPFCYSELTVSEKNGRMTVKEATLIESFFELRCSLLSSSLGSYLLELACECAREEEDERELLQLLLNSLYALHKQLAPADLVKTVFELRLLSIEGCAPIFDCCAACGKPLGKDFSFSPADGGTVCSSCRGAGNKTYLPFGEGARRAMSHILLCPPKRIFAFRLSDNALFQLMRVSEESVLFYFEHNFESLKFYNTVKGELPEE